MGKFMLKIQQRTTLVVQWLRLHTSKAGGMGSSLTETKILHVLHIAKRKKKNQLSSQVMKKKEKEKEKRSEEYAK